ncbi:MAG: hypothetical protein QXU97_03655 [Fervidicoccaceae archaeon]
MSFSARARIPKTANVMIRPETARIAPDSSPPEASAPVASPAHLARGGALGFNYHCQELATLFSRGRLEVVGRGR